MKSKILFILHIPPPINGAALVGEYIKNSIQINSYFDTDYVNLTASFSLDKINKGGLDKFRIILSIIRNVLKKLNKSNYDLCYMTFTATGPGFYKDFIIVLILNLFKVKVVYHFHNKGIAHNSKKWYNGVLYKYIFKNARCILLAPSLYYDIKKYVNKENIYFCPNGIPDLTQSIISNDIEESKPIRFLFLSNMLRQKGVLELLEACQIVQSVNVNFECHFIGAWADVTEEEFISTVDSLGINDIVIFHGKKYGQEKVAFFEDCDVFVFPTFYHNECFPLVLLEAMQFGLPIITTSEGAIEEIVINNETGIIVEQKNVAALAEAMINMIKEPKIREDYGVAGKKRFKEKFTLSIFEKRLQSILINVLNN
ncbi:glycosyltransferase family 4 protein [Algibacter mikhailovii]|uniref:glycosyltransferase family 4 protein n=1 Tax=Algibacter mikhailovii TaxID=425498 RepID=UPI002494F29F|nr:glycosyltransferase family 4 protein [Algibacter mikhailovii]